MDRKGDAASLATATGSVIANRRSVAFASQTQNLHANHKIQDLWEPGDGWAEDASKNPDVYPALLPVPGGENTA